MLGGNARKSRRRHRHDENSKADSSDAHCPAHRSETGTRSNEDVREQNAGGRDETAHRHGYARTHPADPSSREDRRQHHPTEQGHEVERQVVGGDRRDHLEVEGHEEED